MHVAATFLTSQCPSGWALAIQALLGVQEAAAAQRKKGRAAGGGGRAGGDRRPERPPQQRYASVEDHWRKLNPEQRRDLLRLPVRDLLAGEVSAWPMWGDVRLQIPLNTPLWLHWHLVSGT